MRTPNNNNILDARAVFPLEYLRNFWRSLDLLLINCELELDLPWSKRCIISAISITPVMTGNSRTNPTVPAVAARQATGATFQMNNAKIFVTVAILYINNNIKF